jgi:p-cumate 2,3-dioxygenase alpha subunit
VNFDRNAVPLSDYPAGAKEYIDLVADQNEAGMEVVGSGQQYIINANWKLLAENSIDAFHGFPVHSTYFDYLKTLGRLRMDSAGSELQRQRHARPRQRPCRHRVRLAVGPADRALGAVDGRGQARHLEALRASLIKRFGEQRGTRIAEFSRNMLIFPNPGDQRHHGDHHPHLHAGGARQDDGQRLGARRARRDRELRKLRLFNFLEFLGPGGFATPDDQEALENCQRGYQNVREVGWNDISKGMPRHGPADERRRGADALLLAPVARPHGRPCR